ncbi:hypothetical protein, partial [Bacillus sp. WP8]|uniref:hypothetical protein n=1 Tax=Bacillus sp. WP8 TaxID=756828 RepID=UPI0037BEB3ED
MKTHFPIINPRPITQNLQKAPITSPHLFNIHPFRNLLLKLHINRKHFPHIIQPQISPQFPPHYTISPFSYS